MATTQDDSGDPPPLSLRDARFAGGGEARLWRWRLSLFLHALSAFELLKGLANWALLIAAGGAAEPMAGRPAGWFVATGFLAVADPVAAVGLWVGAAWGVAIWLIAALGQIVIASLGGPTLGGSALIAATVAAMAIYVALSLKARRESS